MSAVATPRRASTRTRQHFTPSKRRGGVDEAGKPGTPHAAQGRRKRQKESAPPVPVIVTAVSTPTESEPAEFLLFRAQCERFKTDALAGVMARAEARHQADREKARDESHLGEEEGGLFSGVQDLLDGEQDIATVRKDHVFASEVTAEEQEIIARRVAEKQRQFHEYTRRQRIMISRRMQALFSHIRDEEVFTALDMHNGSEEETAAAFTKPGFMQDVRRAMASNPAPEPATMERRRQRHKPQRSTRARTHSTQVYERARLNLDEALKDADSKEFWSPARVAAFAQIETNPNAYYYRFNAPNEAQRTGRWTPEEETLFFNRAAEVGVDGQWGIFSQAIPGRVGYQCSNFYRLLLQSGRVSDPNYYLDDRGKAHYKFKTPRKGVTSATTAPKRPRAPPKPDDRKGKRGKKGRKRPRWSSESDSDECGMDDDDTPYRPSSTHGETRRVENPLPGFIDPITLDEVVQPAISPYGHVMEYTSWVMTLTTAEPRNTCPFTKQPLKKRDIVVLTPDNIAEYRAKIANAQ